MVKDFASSLPSAEEIVRALGLHRRSAGSDLAPSLALFGAGILVGAGLALFLAPSSGRELREDLTQRATELRSRVAGGSETTDSDGDTAAAHS